MRATKLAILSVLALVFALVVPVTALAEDEPLPVARSFAPAVAQQLQDPDSPPPGANDFSCVPTEQHPNPVILVHGLFANQTVNWQTFSPLLANNGYCVYTLTYGLKDGVGSPVYQPGGLKAMERSAEELDEFVDKVLASTGSSEVDLLGHSQGTLMPSYYVRFLDGGAKVDRYVSLTPLWEGTTLYGLSTLYSFAQQFGLTPALDSALDTACESCTQFLRGSEFLEKLHAKGVFDPGVTYTNIVTRYDQAVVPYTSGIAEGDNITNIVLQDECRRDYSDHAAVAFSPNAAGHVLNALDPAHAKPVECVYTTPLGAP
ncbi:MAG: alpha/beta fold hydrolase [Actinophytocola sp.]|nr:alpha/beta fold hydrolase [Actinophytocola sp.]